MTTWKLTLEYDGTDFSGWQIQPNARTVQEVLEQALHQIVGSPVRVAGAGRTDSGVHAAGQVASMAMEKEFRPEALLRSLNGVLPEDVAVLRAKRVHSDFHARFSAIARRYRYTIMQRPTALDRRFVWECMYGLDDGLLQTCAESIMGEHDFGSFAKVDGETEHDVCRILEARWTRQDGRLELSVRANRFLYGMVRALVGTMVDVARGYRTWNEWEGILQANDRRTAGAAAPAKGLCLMDITY
jgi:tRNA pseudouridine38-40 synthase